MLRMFHTGIIAPTPIILNGEDLCIRVCVSFFISIFHAKSDTTNNDWTELSDISCHIKALSHVIRTTLINSQKTF